MAAGPPFDGKPRTVRFRGNDQKGEVTVKKTYHKPTLIRRAALSAVTASIIVSVDNSAQNGAQAS
jgi:hypothetical protein